MAKHELCRVSNCKNKITYKGTVCGTHKWRMKKYKSYDLPTHKGDPSVYVPKPGLPEGIVKECPTHGFLKSEETYHRYYKGKISTYYCKDCMATRGIKAKYVGLKTIEEYDELLRKQNGVCAICFKENTIILNNKLKRMPIDHDHATKKTRGLLCSFCNSMLGYARDSIELLESAIAYLKKHQ